MRTIFLAILTVGCGAGGGNGETAAPASVGPTVTEYSIDCGIPDLHTGVFVTDPVLIQVERCNSIPACYRTASDVDFRIEKGEVIVSTSEDDADEECHLIVLQ